MGGAELPGKRMRQCSASGLGKSLFTADALGKVPLICVAGVRTGEGLGGAKDGAKAVTDGSLCYVGTKRLEGRGSSGRL